MAEGPRKRKRRRSLQMEGAAASPRLDRKRRKSGGITEAARHHAQAEGDTMPGGRFPIRNAHDLENAKHDFGRANDKPAVRRWIDKRAKELGEPPLGGDKGK